jgi:hypothetical protein
MTSVLPPLEPIHPSAWQASQLARSRRRLFAPDYQNSVGELPAGGRVGALAHRPVQVRGACCAVVNAAAETGDEPKATGRLHSCGRRPQ